MRPIPHQRDDQAQPCPPWCGRDHHPGDGADDRLHQSSPAFVAVVHGDPRFAPDDDAQADAVVLRLVQRSGSTTVWLEATSEEGRALRLLVSAESAARLAGAMATLLTSL